MGATANKLTTNLQQVYYWIRMDMHNSHRGEGEVEGEG